MSGVEEVSILFTDLEDVRQILTACAGYFYAEDLQRAQISFSAVTKSPLTKEIELIQTRFDGYLGDYLRQKYEAEQEELEEIEEDDEFPEEILGVEVKKEEVAQEVEPLSSTPLGEPKIIKQKGRRVTKKELLERAAEEDGLQPG